ncbi:hypothetical protein [Sulfitobacter profundi]|uniref:Uncharacterized protein n=1 Tax=Sulfitobacter profundi TaxID=2679961 RepID=A0ABW1YXL3_9RHOB
MRIGYVGFAPEAMAGDTPIADKKVRQALIHATNRGAIVEAFAGGASEVLNTPATRPNSGARRTFRPMNTTRRKPRLCWPKQAMKTASRWKWCLPPCPARRPRLWLRTSRMSA